MSSLEKERVEKGENNLSDIKVLEILIEEITVFATITFNIWTLLFVGTT